MLTEEHGIQSLKLKQNTTQLMNSLGAPHLFKKPSIMERFEGACSLGSGICLSLYKGLSQGGDMLSCPKFFHMEAVAICSYKP